MWCVAEALPLFFAANHHQYARYGVAYMHMMQRLPEPVYHAFMKGEHTIHLKDGIYNGIWNDMSIETTWMQKGHGAGINIWAFYLCKQLNQMNFD